MTVTMHRRAPTRGYHAYSRFRKPGPYVISECGRASGVVISSNNSPNTPLLLDVHACPDKGTVLYYRFNECNDDCVNVYTKKAFVQ